jgi:hypothetical protein
MTVEQRVQRVRLVAGFERHIGAKAQNVVLVDPDVIRVLLGAGITLEPDPDKVRARLSKLLAEARAAQRLPWEPTRLSLYRTIFPQLTLWLPTDEGAQLRFEFEMELARLEAARRLAEHIIDLIARAFSAERLVSDRPRAGEQSSLLIPPAHRRAECR